MTLTSCTILVTRQSDRFVAMTRSLIKELQLGNGKTVTLRIGSKSITVPIKILNRKGEYLSITSSVASSIHLPGPGKCHVLSTGNGREVKIGPLIGILTSAGSDPSNPFGPRAALIHEFLQSGKDLSYQFAFAPNNVNWENETVTGYFHHGGKWIRRTVPLPDVVYNRLPSRVAEKTGAIRDFKERFVRRKIPLFNWSFFDKWDVYRLLDDDTEAFKFVPESHINPTSEEIRDLLQKHKFVYLKPTAGSLGFGIFRLTYNPGRGYYVRYRRGSENVLMRFSRFEGLMSMLKRNRIRLQNYVVQQGIRLIEIDGCPIDFRFHMTKNGKNEWAVSGIGAKKAGKGSVTTHIRTGGQLMTPEQVLQNVYGNRAEQVLERSKSVAIKLAESIESHYNHPIGELGFDLGIDQDENVWMFEANSKPGRTIFKHPSLKIQGKACFDNLFDHCMYLSRFRPGRD